VAGLHVLADTMADQRRLRGAIDKRYEFVLVVFGEVFVFNLKGKRELRPGRETVSTGGEKSSSSEQSKKFPPAEPPPPPYYSKAQKPGCLRLDKTTAFPKGQVDRGCF
jgi:hypothetical protein